MKAPLVAQVSLHDTDPNESRNVSLDPSNYSSWNRLVRATARIRRFCYNARQKTAAERLSGHINASEIRQAQLFLIRKSQENTYSRELRDLSKNSSVSVSSPLLKLRPVFCERSCLLKVGGRLGHIDMHPIILPTRHPVTRLITADCHERLLHAGTEHTVSQMRETYWVPRIRQLVKSVIRECRVCRRNFSQPRIPRMADVPPARLGIGESVWCHTGTDVFGPLMVKQRRSSVKRWIILFVSMSIRAVHMEILSNMTSDSMLCSLLRFSARRGSSVRHFYCDQGSNYIGSSRELKQLLKCFGNDENFVAALAKEGIDWHFNPPKASHMGGTWEIQVKAAKRSLMVVLRDRLVHEEVLSTAVCQVEYVMNSRPLSYTGDDPEAPQPLTANHFLHMNFSSSPVSVLVAVPATDVSCRKRWQQALALSHQLWQRWRREVLPTMTVAQKWHEERRNLQVGDVVLIVDWSAPRGQWPLGRVVEVFYGRDDRVRSARVKSKSGLLTRPSSHLCLLEESVS